MCLYPWTPDSPAKIKYTRVDTHQCQWHIWTTHMEDTCICHTWMVPFCHKDKTVQKLQQTPAICITHVHDTHHCQWHIWPKHMEATYICPTCERCLFRHRDKTVRKLPHTPAIYITHMNDTHHCQWHMNNTYGSYKWIWGGYDEWAAWNYKSLLQNIVSFIGLFCKRDRWFQKSTNRSHPISHMDDTFFVIETRLLRNFCTLLTLPP